MSTERSTRDMLWVPKDGRPGIPLKALGDSHLENLIRYTERVAERAEERARMLMRQQDMWEPRNRGLSMGMIEQRWMEMRGMGPSRREFEEEQRRRAQSPLPQEVADSLRNAKHWWLWHQRFVDEREARENGAPIFPELAPPVVDLDADSRQGQREVEPDRVLMGRPFRQEFRIDEEIRPGPIVVVQDEVDEQVRRTLPPTRRIAASARRIGRALLARTPESDSGRRVGSDTTPPSRGTSRSKKKTEDK